MTSGADLAAVPRARFAPAETRWCGLVALALAVYIPFEDFLLKWLPLSEPLYALARLASEGFLFAALAAVVCAHVVRGLPLRRTPLDGWILLFLGLGVTSTVLGPGGLVGGLLNFRALVRYIAVYYLVVYGRPERRLVVTTVRAMLLVALLQTAVGGLQGLQGGPSEFWLPRASEFEVGGVQKQFTVLSGGIEQGAVIGTMGHSVALGLYGLIAGVLAFALYLSADRSAFRRGFALLGLAGVLGGALLMTYSRGALLGYGLGLAAALWFLRARPEGRRLLQLSVLLVPVALGALVVRGLDTEVVKAKQVYVDPLANVEMLFSGRLLEHQENSRLWVLGSIGGEVVSTVPPLGFGPEEETAKRQIFEASSTPMHRLIGYKAFEDVFWVALLAYYGFVGLGAFVVLLVALYRRARSVMRRTRDPLELGLSTALAALLVVVFPLTFLVRTFEFRSFGYYFWLLAAFVVDAWLRLDAREGPAERATGIGSAPLPHKASSTL